MINLEDLLQDMVDREASDLFLKAGSRPSMRIDGSVQPSEYEMMTVEDMDEIGQNIMTEDQWRQFMKGLEMDLALGVRGVGRFRVNCYKQRGTIGMVFRHVLAGVQSFEDLNLPHAVQELADKPRGMTLVTGTTGSGKSTTLASMIGHINNVRCCHIVTIEDPIEYLHQDNKAIISQREVGFDTHDFSDALKRVLRQSPDVILIGEMRDLETIQTAIQAAETGHLVFSTLHTLDAVQTVERIINYFPAYLHPQIRLELSLCMQGVISQRLMPRAGGNGRIPAIEIMICTPTIKKLLYEGRTLELNKFINEGRQYGMQTFNQSLLALYNARKISLECALEFATSPDEFKLAAQGITSGRRF
ncbi:PilT/PilU family type 4a pilus ATPase [Candidatus Sumerlaeota bacterium]|nr:PilT/PilU family type 4a pilus ATPase [Candidatus Sumerlaeota bacterium]